MSGVSTNSARLKGQGRPRSDVSCVGQNAKAQSSVRHTVETSTWLPSSSQAMPSPYDSVLWVRENSRVSQASKPQLPARGGQLFRRQMQSKPHYYGT